MADTSVLDVDERRQFARLVAQAWSDDELRSRYAMAPREVLAEYGIACRKGELAPELPPRPADDVVVEELQLSAGATRGSLTCPVSCYSCIGVCLAG